MRSVALRPVVILAGVAIVLLVSGVAFGVAFGADRLPGLSGAARAMADVGVVYTPATSAAGRLVLAEGDAAADCDVTLAWAPTGEVTLLFESLDASESAVSPTMLTFTPGDWDQPQTIQITPLDDDLVDGDQDHRISVSVNGQATVDPYYAGLDPKDIYLTVADGDAAGFVFSPVPDPFALTEGGDGDTYYLRLTAQPAGDVTVTFDDQQTPARLSFSPSNLIFTPEDWNVARPVHVTALDDDLIETSPIVLDLLHTATADAGSPYDGLTSDGDVQVQVTSEDSADYAVSPTALTVVEGENTPQWFTVALTAEPEGEVTLRLVEDSFDELSFVDASSSSISRVTLNSSNYEGVTVGVKSPFDFTSETVDVYHISFNLVSSTDSAFTEAPADIIDVTTYENGYRVIILDVDGSSLDVSEGGGTAAYDVTLSTDPASSVSISLSCSASDLQFDLPGGGAADWVSDGVLQFDSGNWNTPQTIVVQAVDDANAEPIETIAISHTAGGWVNASLDVVIDDNDTAGVHATALDDILVQEDGSMALFGVALQSEPSSDVTVVPIADDATEVELLHDDASALTQLVFSPNDWDKPQYVVVRGKADGREDGDQFVSIDFAVQQASGLQEYNGIWVAPVRARCMDVDEATVSAFVIGDDTLKEGGASLVAGFTLGAAPHDGDTPGTAQVTLRPDAQVELEWPVNSGTWVGAPGRAVVTVGTAHTSADPNGGGALPWDEVRYRVRAVDDAIAEGLHQGAVRMEVDSTDPAYGALPAHSMRVSIDDGTGDGADPGDDAAGAAFTQSGSQISETGGQATFTVQLTSRPRADVLILLSIDKPDEAQLSASSLSFGMDGYADPQSVTITGLDDDERDGDQTVAVVVDIASADPGYDDLTVAGPPSFVNLDDEPQSSVMAPVWQLLLDWQE